LIGSPFTFIVELVAICFHLCLFNLI